jgi:rhamnulokinase
VNTYLAIDLGAGSGRIMAVRSVGETIELDQVCRFDSPAIEQEGSLFWDIHLIWTEITRGLKQAAQTYGSTIRSIGVDSWGVDYAWFDSAGELSKLPYCYRDARTHGSVDEVAGLLGRDAIFEETGIQFMAINSLYQIVDDLKKGLLSGRFLMIADMINYWLTGRQVCERTNASTTQLYNPRTQAWSKVLVEGIGLPTSTLPPLVAPGETLGPLQPKVAAEMGLANTPVIAVGSHDTASAVAGVPASTDSFAYLSCGTWALLGTEVAEPIITDTALDHNFTNETGVEGTYRLLKNITGLWILQECRRVWQDEDKRAISYDELTEFTAHAAPFTAFIDPDDIIFSHHGNLPEMIQEYCQSSGQSMPITRGQIARIAMESLALKVASILEQLEFLLGRPLNVLHVIGGGVQNRFLMQCIANATQRRVIAGPTEATALGNALVQMIANSEVASLRDGRARLAKAIDTTAYEPSESWDNARQRFRSLLAKNTP